jgi:hypothetical protein
VKGKGNSGDLGVDKRIMLKQMLKKQGLRIRMGFI